jgi:hypothetical protein
MTMDDAAREQFGRWVRDRLALNTELPQWDELSVRAQESYINMGRWLYEKGFQDGVNSVASAL